MNIQPIRATRTRPFARALLFSLFAGMTGITLGQTNVLTFQSSGRQASLLELYTSEGCSSCPPAEGWLSGLKEASGLWRDFVPVAFHVDYWDYLGWRDPWAKPNFSDRQRAYAALWRSDSVYTPAFVLDGKEWHNQSGRTSFPEASKMKAGMLTVTSSDTNHWNATFAPAIPGWSDYEIHAALLVGGVSSEVKAGENHGHRLEHDFVVAALQEAPLRGHGGEVTGDFSLGRPGEATKGSLALAVWITRAGRLESLQATGGWISPPIRR